MSKPNRGKEFETVAREAFLKIPDVSVDRLHDQMSGYKGSQNICDFIVYKKPYQCYVECKTIHGNTLSIYGKDPKHKYGNITNTQWEGLTEKSLIDGVFAGVLCWWIDKDVTLYLPIHTLIILRRDGHKSVRYDSITLPHITIVGKKKRVFFDYDMNSFFKGIHNGK